MDLPDYILKEMEEYEVEWINGRWDVITDDDEIISIQPPNRKYNSSQTEELKMAWKMVKLNAKKKEVQK